MDKVRNRLRSSVPGGKKKQTMCHRSPLRKHTYQQTVAEKRELKRWFKIKPELRVAYELKEKFFTIWYSPCKATAQESYRQWVSSITAQLAKDFKGIITAMTNWGEYVFNYFDHKYTNAFTESTNRHVKDIQRDARNGKFEMIKAKAIYGAIVRRQLQAARAHTPNPNMRRAKRAKPAAELSSPGYQPSPIQLQLEFS